MKKILKLIFSEEICSKLIYVKYSLQAQRNKRVLGINSEFKNMYSGKRCFIFGNGPSLNSLNFSDFKDEIVFTVNQIARKEDYQKLMINYHIWADPFFFKLDLQNAEDTELLGQMTKVHTEDNSPICFFPIEQKDFVTKNIGNSLDVRFFQPVYSLRHHMNRKINYTKIVPSFYTVIQYAITLAIYMGFKEIYLLGCETSNILTSINTRLDQFLDSSYSYALSDNEKKRMKKVNNLTTFREDMYNNLNVIDDYQYLNEYCCKHNIELVNCTPGGLLEGIERRKIDEVLQNN